MVLNSMGWVVELGYELLKHAVEARSLLGYFGLCGSDWFQLKSTTWMASCS